MDDDQYHDADRIDYPDILSVRRALVANGYVPVPLHGKAPALASWQQLENVNPEQLEMWAKCWPTATNTGALTALMPTLDVDILNPDAVDAIIEHVRDKFEEHGYVPARTGKAPKVALIFRTIEPFTKITVNLTAPNGDNGQKVELLALGQQVVVDGMHPETKEPYYWQGGNPLEIAREELAYLSAEGAQQLIDEVTAILVDRFGYTRNGRSRGKGGNAAAAASDGPTDWADLFKNIHDGCELHDSQCSLAAKLAKAGTHPGAIVNQLRAMMEASAAPRDERFRERLDDIPRLVESAIMKFAGEDDAWKGDSGAQPALSAVELRSMTFQPIKYVVPGVIVEGFTLLAGKPKIGKSWLLLHAAIAVARGGFTLGEIHCIEGDVLYLALEDNLRRLKSRMAKLLGMTQPWPERLHFKCEIPRLIEGGLDVIKDWIVSVDHPRLIVIDVLAMVRTPGKRKDQTQYDADYNAVLELRTLAHDHGLAVVVVHHLRKMAADDPFDTISGTLGLSGAPDTTLVLQYDSGGSGAIVLHGRGRDLPEIEKALTFNRDACTWTIAGELDDVRNSGARLAILSAMREIAVPASAKEITAYTRIKTVNVSRMLQRMVRDGVVKRLERGKYELLTETGQ